MYLIRVDREEYYSSIVEVKMQLLFIWLSVMNSKLWVYVILIVVENV